MLVRIAHQWETITQVPINFVCPYIDPNTAIWTDQNSRDDFETTGKLRLRPNENLVQKKLPTNRARRLNGSQLAKMKKSIPGMTHEIYSDESVGLKSCKYT